MANLGMAEALVYFLCKAGYASVSYTGFNGLDFYSLAQRRATCLM